MSLLWRDLALLEALVAVIADNLTLILPLPFRYHHFISCGGGVTVDACDKKLLLRFFSVGSVLHHIAERLQVCFRVFGIDGLFWVFGVVDRVVKPAFHIPYLTDSHYPDPFFGSRYFLRISIWNCRHLTASSVSIGASTKFRALAFAAS